MAKKTAELGALEVSRLKKPGLNFVGGVAGLALQVAPTGARSWVLRIVVGTKRRELGLGGFPDVGLADARRLARDLRESIRAGNDPVADRKAVRARLIADQKSAMTFSEASRQYIDSQAPQWKNAKHGPQWTATLKTYAAPFMGNLLVRDIQKEHVLAALKPIWTDKTETATRVRSRIESVIAWSDKHANIERLNPARWKGHLELLLPKPSKVAKKESHPSLPYARVHDFVQALGARRGVSAKALEYLILTAQRTGPVIEATWDEIDWDNSIWVSPASKMKMDQEHRTALSPRAVQLLREMEKTANGDFIFQSHSEPIGNAAMLELIKGMHTTETPWVDPKMNDRRIVPHGFRSTFKVWATEQTNYPTEMSEIALAHQVGNSVMQVYQRSDMVEKRRKMMTAWANFIAKPPAKANVVPIDSRAESKVAA